MECYHIRMISYIIYAIIYDIIYHKHFHVFVKHEVIFTARGSRNGVVEIGLLEIVQ